MIKLLQRNELNEKKYNTCIKKSIQSKVYAYSWYLDCVTDSWSVLVQNDYQVVMPIPYIKTRRNFYRNKILQPLFCQQLGIFSLDEISVENFKHFITLFLNLKPKGYQFNTNNTSVFTLLNTALVTKVNYELALNNTYAKISQNYSKNLQRNLVKAQKITLKIKEISLNKVILMKKQTSKVALKSKNYRQLKKLLATLQVQEKGISFGVFFEEKLIATAFFIKTENSIIHLVSSSLEKGKRVGAISFLFDTIIKKYATKNIIFDFEGSMIPGVARFFKGFGAQPKTYLSL